MLFRKGKTILREEGLASFIKTVVLFLRSSFSFAYRTYYIYENTLGGSQFEPKIQDVTLKIVSTPQQLNELVASGFTFPSWDVDALKEKASRGAISFCVFVEQNLAHITWIALSEGAKNCVDPFPLKIDWQNEAWSGSSRTGQNYQGMGLFSYAYTEIFRFLKERGLSKDRFTIEKNNVVSNHTMVKFGSQIIAHGRYLKLLWWTSWKVKPIEKKRSV